MEITTRGLWTLIHGMGFGALYLLACSGAIVELYRHYSPSINLSLAPRDEAFLRRYLVAMAILAWMTVLTGAYVIYPWYRAVPPAGSSDLALFSQRLLLSNPSTSGWHRIGMEWKEHIAWVVPISITMAASVVARYGRNLRQIPLLRNAVLGFLLVSLLAASIAGFFGAMLNKTAPLRGGQVMQLMQGWA
jgi:hypothetical protein